MKIRKPAIAGTFESSDISVAIEPKDSRGIEIHLKSSVEKQFGPQIKSVIIETLEELGIDQAIIRAHDKGALDCIIKARIQTAVYRAAEMKEYQW